MRIPYKGHGAKRNPKKHGFSKKPAFKLHEGPYPKHKTSTDRGRAVTMAVDNVSQHNDLSKTHISVGGHGYKHSHPSKYKAIATLQHQNAAVFDSIGSGLQIWQLANIFGTTDNFLQSSFSPGLTDANTTKWPINPFGLNPFQKYVGSEAVTGTGIPTQDRVYLRSFKGEMMFNSPELTPQEVKIYFFMSKKDLPVANSPVQIWNSCLTNLNASGGGSLAIQRIDGAVNVSPTSGLLSPFTYGASPFNYRDFNSIYKVVGSHTFVLGAGCTKKITWHQKIFKPIDRQTIIQIASGVNTIMKGVTLQVVVQSRGVPVLDTSNASYKPVTPSSCKLFMTSSFEAQFAFAPPNDRIAAGVNWTDGNFGYHPVSLIGNEALVSDVDTKIFNATN